MASHHDPVQSHALGTVVASLRWRCSLSHRLHNGALHEEARQCARRAEQAIRDGRYGEALGEGMRMAVC